jgi:hypothetical protein
MKTLLTLFIVLLLGMWIAKIQSGAGAVHNLAGGRSLSRETSGEAAANIVHSETSADVARRERNERILAEAAAREREAEDAVQRRSGFDSFSAVGARSVHEVRMSEYCRLAELELGRRSPDRCGDATSNSNGHRRASDSHTFADRRRAVDTSSMPNSSYQPLRAGEGLLGQGSSRSDGLIGSDECGYRGSSGTCYKYDLSNELDRLKYDVDERAKLRDQTFGVSDGGAIIDRDRGAYGGGIQ